MITIEDILKVIDTAMYRRMRIYVDPSTNYITIGEFSFYLNDDSDKNVLVIITDKGHTEINITSKELAEFTLKLHQVIEYCEHMAYEDITNFLAGPKEQAKLSNISQLYDEDDTTTTESI